MSFAQRFAAGQQIAKNAMDAYDTARKKREFSDIMQAQPEMLAPVSDVAPAPAATTNPDGTAAVPVLGVQPTTPKQYKFLGNTYDTALTPEQVSSLRYERLADVIGKDDPVRGLEMRRTLARDKREDTKFGWEVKDRDTAEKIKTGRQEQYKRYSEMSDAELATAVGGAFSQDGSGIDAMLVFDPKAKEHILASNIPGFPTQRFSREELINKAMGIWESGNGDFSAGMKMLMDSVRAQREIGDSNFNRSAAIAKANADVYFQGRTADRGDAQLRLSEQGLAIQRAAAAREGRNPLLEKVAALQKLGVPLTPAEIKKLAGAGAAAFDPADYASTVSRFVSSGMELKDARYAADELFGVPSAPVNDSSLVSQNKSRDPKTGAPVERPSATGLLKQFSDAYNGESPAWFDLRGQASRAAYGVATRKPEQTK